MVILSEEVYVVGRIFNRIVGVLMEGFVYEYRDNSCVISFFFINVLFVDMSLFSCLEIEFFFKLI